MEQANKKDVKKKGFFARLVDKLDKAMEAKSKQCSCCRKDNPKDN